MKRLIMILFALVACTAMNAQYVVSDKYNLWFEDSGNEVITRKSVQCEEDYQDLWNGCHVRLIGRTTYIYKGTSSILYGDEINLLYNGYYRVRRSGTWYLCDPGGDIVSGIYGSEILYYPWGYVTVKRSAGYWDVFHSGGRKLDFYSDASPCVFSNGCWAVRHGRYWYAYDGNGRQIDGVYGDELRLLNDGRWKCVRGSYISYVECTTY